MRRLIEFLFGKWEYVGHVEARTVLVDNAGEKVPGGVMQGYWLLSEHRRFGGKRARLIGDPGISSSAVHAEASVKAWLAGGPLPVKAEPAETVRPKGDGPKIVSIDGKIVA